MNIINIGEPIITKTGTKISKYIENGRLYKLIDFENSTNRAAKQKGLVKTVVRYGEGNKPETCFDTFERKIGHGKPAENPVSVPQVQAKPTEVPPSQTVAKVEEKVDGGNVSAEKESLQDKLIWDSYKDKNRESVVYKSYDSFVSGVKRGLERYKEVIPADLYKSINERYGTEEKSIMKIVQEHNVDLDRVPVVTNDGKRRYFRQFVKAIVNSENKLAAVKDSAPEVKTSIIYTNAWTRSWLRQDFGMETAKTAGNPWNILPRVWHKSLHPEETKYPTSKLIDSYLVQVYKNGRRSYNGENPIAKIEQETDALNTKTSLLKRLYRLSEQLGSEKQVMRTPAYKALKESTDTAGMAKSIENIEEHYKDTFFEHFWTDERKARFSDALAEENEKFGEKIEISSDIYKSLISDIVIDTKEVK